MLKRIIKLLTPIFVGMGAAATDVENYVNLCAGYVYGLLAAMVILAALLVAAHWVKKKNRSLIRWNSVLAFLLAVLFLFNGVCYGPLNPLLEDYLSGGIRNLTTDMEEKSREIVKQVGEEGIVLVKNDGLLPLADDVKNLNVFGWASIDPVYGGTGSGETSTESSISFLQSLEEAGFTTNSELTEMYRAWPIVRGAIKMNGQDWTLPEPTADRYTTELMEGAKAHSDVAVIVVSRSGGEEADLPTDMNAVIHGTYRQYNPDNLNSIGEPKPIHHYTDGTYRNNGDYDDFEPGEHYLELSVSEENMVAKVCENFDKVIVIVNANNAMELGWTDAYPQIKAVLLAPGGGATGFAAIGEILCGAVNPSGHTADTYVKDLTAAPYFQNIGHHAYNNVQDILAANRTAPNFQGIVSFVNYVEGIYVGYKFYETAAVEGLIHYDEVVQYPFGYGLSYTTFEQKIVNFKSTGDKVTFKVKVTNTGAVAGKSVVQVYFTPPYTSGGIEKAAVNLIDYAKTKILKPGASETISFSIAKEDFVSYDSSCIKTANGGYILEKGTYEISIRENSHTVIDFASFTVAADIDYSSGRASDKVAATNQFEAYSNGGVNYLSRADGFANYKAATAAPAASAYAMSDAQKAAVAMNLYAKLEEKAASMDSASDGMPTMGALNGITLADMRGLAYDDPKWELLLDEMSFDEMSALICLGGWHTEEVASIGKVRTDDSDGPAGLNNIRTGKRGTAFCTEVMMAQTWNTQLAQQLGLRLGAEFAAAENWGAYAPAMNTHRSAFSGRNFEYYSEDGVLAGKIAAAQAGGMGKTGVFPCIKHFALNDQEINRCAALNTFSTEQAIREIYLKPFEMVIKAYEYPQLGVMSSYNWIGSEPCVTNPHLLQSVLRGEWGFEGMVVSDYDGGYGYQLADIGIRTGNDLYLGTVNNTKSNALTQSATSVLAMREAAHNILYTTCNSGVYALTESESLLDAAMQPINMTCGIVLSLGFLAGIALWLWKYRKVAR